MVTARRQRLGRRACSSAARCCSRACGPASSSGDTRAGAARHAAGQRRHAAGRGSGPHLADPDVAAQIVGTLGPIPASRAPTVCRRRATRPSAKVGIDGLEHIFQRQLAGQAGGQAARRPARTGQHQAAARPRRSRRRSIPTIERAAVTAMGGSYAGIAAMDPRTGGLLALAGVAFSALQPPGSTMKMITATGGARGRDLVKLGDDLPDPDLGDDRRLHAPERRRRGVRRHAPQRVRGVVQLGVRAARRQGRRARGWSSIAERFGFNQPPSIPGRGRERRSRRPRTIGDAARRRLLGDRPGQGSGDRARDDRRGGHDRHGRPPPDPDPADGPAAAGSSTSPTATWPARSQKMMVAVVQFGTGTSAADPGRRPWPARPAPPS